MCPSRSIPPGPEPGGWRLLLPGLLLLALAAPVTAVAANWPRQLAYREPGPVGVRATGGLTLTVDAERTVLDRDGLLLIIDYHLLQVIRQPAGRAERVVYPLVAPGQPAAEPATPAEALRRQAAGYRIVATGPGRRVHAWPAVERLVWFGPGLSRLRTAAPLTVTCCGETFGERRVRCLVSDAVPGHDALARLAAARRPVVRANPLLLQLDPVNLILPLGALPVRLEEGGDQGRVLELQP